MILDLSRAEESGEQSDVYGMHILLEFSGNGVFAGWLLVAAYLIHKSTFLSYASLYLRI